MPTLFDRLKAAVAPAPKTIVMGNFPADASKNAYGLMEGIYPAARGEPPPRGTQERLEGYNQMPWLRTCAECVADAVASVQWQLFIQKKGNKVVRNRIYQRGNYTTRALMKAELDDRNELVEIESHPFLDLVIDKGNSFLTGQVTRKVTQLHLDLAGEAFWLKQRAAGGLLKGVVTAVWPIPPHWILGTPTPTHPFFRVGYRAWIGDIPATEILWMANPNPVFPYGRGSGLGGALSDELETDEYASRFLKQYFYNDATPPFIVSPKGDGPTSVLTETEARRLEQSWLNKLQGYWKAHKPLFTTRGVDIKEFQRDLRSMQMVQLREHERDVVMQVFRIPPEIFGVLQHCLDDQTECLTRTGWKRHETLSTSDEVATWNEAAHRLEYQRPLHVFRYAHDGPMHHWTAKGVDFVCTPNHRLWVKHGRRQGQREGWVFATSDEVASWTSAFWRITGGGYVGTQDAVTIPGKWHGLATPGTVRHRAMLPRDTRIAAETFAPFLGYYVAEGWVDPERPGGHNVFYSQNADRYVDEMRASFRGLGLGEPTERTRINHKGGKSHIEWRLAHKALSYWLREHVGLGADQKRLPVEVFEWPPAAQHALLTALIHGDGSTQTRQTTSWTYASMSEGLIDDVQRLAIILGLCTSKGRQKTSGIWMLTLTARETRHLDRYGPSWMQLETYRGMVWCVEVPNHRFFTRRNGQVALHGNSNRATIDSADYIFTTKCQIPRLDFLRAQLQEKLLPDYDDRLILDYVSPVQEDKTQQLAAATAAPWSLSVNEWRSRAGEGELATGGDIHMVPFTMQPMADLAVPPPSIDKPLAESPSEVIPPDEVSPVKSVQDLRTFTVDGLDRVRDQVAQLATQMANTPAPPTVVTVHPPAITVTVPERSVTVEKTEVNIAASPAPNVHVDGPTIHTPAVHVDGPTIHPTVALPAKGAKKVTKRVTRDAEDRITAITEETED